MGLGRGLSQKIFHFFLFKNSIFWFILYNVHCCLHGRIVRLWSTKQKLVIASACSKMERHLHLLPPASCATVQCPGTLEGQGSRHNWEALYRQYTTYYTICHLIFTVCYYVPSSVFTFDDKDSGVNVEEPITANCMSDCHRPILAVGLQAYSLAAIPSFGCIYFLPYFDVQHH